MDRYCWTEAWAWRNRFRGLDSTRFVLIGADGEELYEVKQYDSIRPKFSLWRPGTWLRQDVKDETVYEAIQKLDDSIRVGYVIEITGVLPLPHQANPYLGFEVILHKVPSRRSFSDWLTQIREVAREELQSEVAKANNA